jgi:hypothetical protein
MVARVENATAHNRAVPNAAPARLAVVTVPGAMNAAVTNRPGPKPARADRNERQLVRIAATSGRGPE